MNNSISAFENLKSQLEHLTALFTKALTDDDCMSLFFKHRNDFNRDLDRARDHAYINWQEGFYLQQAVDRLSNQIESKLLKQMKELRNEVTSESDSISTENEDAQVNASPAQLRLHPVFFKVPSINFASTSKHELRAPTKFICNFG